MFRSLSRILAEIGGSSRTAPPRRSTKLGVEFLENRWVPSTIAGYVFNDQAGTGLYQQGTDPVYSSIPIELLNASGAQIGTTSTDANGHYAFTVNQNVNTNPVALPETGSFGPVSTESSGTATVNKFDPSLGTLQSVQIELNGAVTSDVSIQDVNDPALQTQAETFQSSLSGDVKLQGPGTTSLDASVQAKEPDVTLNAGQSHTFDSLPASNTQSVTLTDAADLAAYTGQAGAPGTASFAATGNAQFNSDGGGGNLGSVIHSTISGQVTVIYTYKPSNALTPGTYTVVETQNPPNTTNGTPTSNGVPVATGTPPDTIPVTLPPGGDSLQNNFPKVVPAAVSGYVYVDNNQNGAFDPGDSPIHEATVNLTGTTTGGTAVSLTTTTAADGSYSFNVAPGDYTITQPNITGYTRGADTVGSLGGTSTPGALTVSLSGGDNGLNYNFGEVQNPPTPLPPGNPQGPPITPTPPTTPQTPTPPATPPDKQDFFSFNSWMWGW